MGALQCFFLQIHPTCAALPRATCDCSGVRRELHHPCRLVLCGGGAQRLRKKYPGPHPSRPDSAALRWGGVEDRRAREMRQGEGKGGREGTEMERVHRIERMLFSAPAIFCACYILLGRTPTSTKPGGGAAFSSFSSSYHDRRQLVGASITLSARPQCRAHPVGWCGPGARAHPGPAPRHGCGSPRAQRLQRWAWADGARGGEGMSPQREHTNVPE